MKSKQKGREVLHRARGRGWGVSPWLTKTKAAEKWGARLFSWSPHRPCLHLIPFESKCGGQMKQDGQVSERWGHQLRPQTRQCWLFPAEDQCPTFQSCRQSCKGLYELTQYPEPTVCTCRATSWPLKWALLSHLGS